MRSIPVARPSEADEKDSSPPKEPSEPPERLDPTTVCGLLKAHPRGGEDFWTAVRAKGTPLVDEIAGDPGHRAVTFLHRAIDHVDSASLLLRGVIAIDCFDAGTLTQIPGSDVWAATYRLDARRRGSYSLVLSPSDQTPEPLDDDTRSEVLADTHPTRRDQAGRWLDAYGIAQPDPFAAHRRPDGSSFLSMPAAPPMPWLPDPTDHGSPAAGEYPGVVRGELAGRKVWRYVPATPATAENSGPVGPLPVVVFLDGGSWTFDGPSTLAGMTAAGLLPPMLAVGVACNGQSGRRDDLCCSEPFTRYLAEDVLDWAREAHPITEDPARTIIAGQSLGGLAALFATQKAEERFGCALAQSGSFWWPEPREWLTEVIDAIPEPTHGVYLSIGSDESSTMTGPFSRMVDALARRGDPIDVHEFSGGHDSACWRVDIARGLAAITARW
jgi:enterochelin esterase family protein